MNWFFILVWLTLSSCTIVDAKLWGHKEEAVEVRHDVHEVGSGPAGRVKEKLCEKADQMCNDEAVIAYDEAVIEYERPYGPADHHDLHKTRLREEALATGAAAGALHHMKEKLSHAKDSAGNQAEYAGENIRHKAREAYDSTYEAGERAKLRAKEAYDLAAEGASAAGERAKYKAQEAYDSTAEGASNVGEKIKLKAQEAYDSAAAGLYSAGEKIKHATHSPVKEKAEVEAEGSLYRAKEKIAEAAYNIKEEIEEHLPHLHKEKAKTEVLGAGAAAAAAAALHNAKEKLVHAKDATYDSTSHAGEKLKHKAQGTYDSAAAGASHAGERVKHKAQEAWDSATENLLSAREKAEHAGRVVKEKLWWEKEKPIVFTHPIFPGFRAWLAIFTAIGAQLALGWLWYNMLFKNLFRKALAEDRAFKFANAGTFKAMPGMSDKLSEAAHFVKDKAANSAAAQKLSQSTAAQKLSQTSETLKEKVSQTGETIKEKVIEGKEKLGLKGDKVKWVSTVPASAPTVTTASTTQVFSSTTPQVTTTTMPISTAPLASSSLPSVSTAPASSSLGSSSLGSSSLGSASTTSSAQPKLAAETNDPAQAAFLREKEKPLLTFEPGAPSGEFIAGPYSAIWGPISSLLVSIIRSFFMFHWLRVLLVQSNWGAFSMAFYFFLGSQFCSMHHYIWEGRPLKLLFIDQGAELALSAATAFIVYQFGIAH